VITVTNVGDAPATGGFAVSDTLQAGLTFASSSSPAWSTATAGPIVTGTHAGTLLPGDSLVLTFQVMVGAAAYPAVSNAAVVSGSGDVNPANDRAVTGPWAVTANWPDMVV